MTHILEMICVCCLAEWCIGQDLLARPLGGLSIKPPLPTPEAIWSPPSGGRKCCPKHECHANDDMHLLTFDGRWWEFHIPGTYIMYRHKTLPLEVQADFKWCGPTWPTATCLRGVAIRAWNSVFIVKYPYGSCVVTTTHTKYAYGPVPSAMIIEETTPGNFKVTLVTGTVIEFNFCGIQLYSSISDFNQVQGLCGDDNDLCADDFTLRGDGLSTAPGANDCNVQHAYFDDFGNSWRVCDYEDLFLCHFEEKTFCQDLFYCSCNKAWESGNNQQTFAFFGSLDEAIKQLHQCINKTDITASVFTKYQVDGSCPGSSPITDKEDGTLPFEQIKPGDLRLDCQTAIGKDTLVNLCVKTGILNDDNVQGAVTECLLDLKLGGGNPAFTASHVSSRQRACLQQAPDTLIDIFAIVEAGTCPNSCNLRGRCERGVCRCYDGSDSIDCAYAGDRTKIGDV